MKQSWFELLRQNRFSVRIPFGGPVIEADGVVTLLSVPLVLGLAALWMFLML